MKAQVLQSHKITFPSEPAFTTWPKKNKLVSSTQHKFSTQNNQVEIRIGTEN